MIKQMAQLLGFIVIAMVMGNSAWAVDCDCSVVAYSPLTASHLLPTVTLRRFELEGYDNRSISSQLGCRKSCLESFEKEMNYRSLNSLLVAHTQNLIESKVVGFNCTGLTTLKFPVRVKAKLGNLGLGHVADVIHVVNHEQICF
jgi:hypothetical protein